MGQGSTRGWLNGAAIAIGNRPSSHLPFPMPPLIPRRAKPAIAKQAGATSVITIRPIP
jgi:hypothetical protein